MWINIALMLNILLFSDYKVLLPEFQESDIFLAIYWLIMKI